MPRHDRLRFVLDLVATSAVLVASIATALTLFQRSVGSVRELPAPRDSSGASRAQPFVGLTLRPPTDANVKGHARWAIVEFSDFQCPYCARYFKSTYPAVQQYLVETGIVEYVFMNFPLDSIHPRAFEAGEAAACAGRQGQFWQMHDRLFDRQEALLRSDLIEDAKGLALNIPVFERCLSGEATAQVTADVLDAKRIGVTGTPTLFIGDVSGTGSITLRRRLSAVSFDLVRQAVFDVVPSPSTRQSTTER